MNTIHDNKIKSYSVDLENNKINLYAEFSENDLVKTNTIVFHDVLVHLFENEMPHSIILDIEKCDINQFFHENIELLNERKGYCWPMFYDTIEELKEKLITEGYYYYVIYSSYGLNGWVVARNCEVVAK